MGLENDIVPITGTYPVRYKCIEVFILLIVRYCVGMSKDSRGRG